MDACANKRPIKIRGVEQVLSDLRQLALSGVEARNSECVNKIVELKVT